MLAVPLQTNDHDPQHIPVPRQDLRSAEPVRTLDMGHGAGPVQATHSVEHTCADSLRGRSADAHREGEAR